MLNSLFEEKALLLGDYLQSTISENRMKLEKASDLFSETPKQGNTIFFCGNGGSASESSHLATGLIGSFKENRVSPPSISLNSGIIAITCTANDFRYDQVYTR